MQKERTGAPVPPLKLALIPGPALFYKRHERVVLQDFRAFPHRERNWQRDKRPHVAPQSLLIDDQFILERVKNAAQVQNDQIDENLLSARYGLRIAPIVKWYFDQLISDFRAALALRHNTESKQGMTTN